MTARQAMERLKALNVQTVVQRAIKTTETAYIELQREQMKAGKQQTGDDIQLSPVAWFPGYSPGYKVRREHMGLQTDHVDLDRSGIFQADLEVNADGSSLNITSAAEYEKWIVHRFGPKIYGLGGKYLTKYKEVYLNPAVALILAEQSGLKVKI